MIQDRWLLWLLYVSIFWLFPSIGFIKLSNTFKPQLKISYLRMIFSYNKIWHLKWHNQIWLKLTLAYLFPKGITVKFCFGKYEHKIPVFGWMIGFKAGFVCMLWRNENKRKEFWEIGYISCYYFHYVHVKLRMFGKLLHNKNVVG